MGNRAIPWQAVAIWSGRWGCWRPLSLVGTLHQEKEQLEERLQQNLCTMQQMEAELEAFQKSCLLQLARSSWVGRVLKSQTGSVEVSLCSWPDTSQASLPNTPWAASTLLWAGAL